MPGPSTIRELTNLLSLPGIGEVGDIVNGLIGLVKAAGYEKDQSESLSKRLSNLIAVANTCEDLENFIEIRGQLQEMKGRFEKKLKRKSRLPTILRAQDRLEAYENLSREITHLMENFQFQQSISISGRLTEEDHRTNKRRIEENFTTIDAYKLSYDEQESSTWSSRSMIPVRENRVVYFRSSQVITTHRFGRMGALRVVHKSFTSHSHPMDKTKVAEEELKQLSRMKHKNLAAIVGVTNGWDGLDGFVVAMGKCILHTPYIDHVSSCIRGALDGIPIKRFFSSTVSGGALARCIQGLDEVIDFFEEVRDQTPYEAGLNEDSISVTPDGRVTVLPHSDHLRRGNYYEWATSTVINLALHEYLWGSGDWENAPREPRWRLADALMNLGRSDLTELRLLKILADCRFHPPHSSNIWSENVFPPFTLCAGDIGGFFESTTPGEAVWEMLQECSNAEATEFVDESRGSDDTDGWQVLPSTYPQYWSWVLDSRRQYNVIEAPHQPWAKSIKRWQEILKRAKAVSEHRKIELDKISYVSSVCMWRSAYRPDSSRGHMSGTHLYFHRNPLARLSPRDFWGFFSTVPDPGAPCTELEDLGWTFKYYVSYETICIGDDWGLRYQRALEAGISAIPGGYPGAYIEERFGDGLE
ncbi:hypothetical protein BDV93DRAFT_610416 [Ceratobasidium sp. AG-I]|nr:hypothetical protein BDV93DRAFT_610416 [Ceratobasidium sp. AG-I]